MFTAAAVLFSAMTLAPPIALPVKPETQHVTLKGKFVVSEEGEGFVFKAGRKEIAIKVAEVKLQKHSVRKLKDLRSGTFMVLFAKFTPWSDGDEFERMSCLVAGDHYVPKHKPTGKSMATWHSGRLSFNSNKTIAYVDNTVLPTGVDRAVCLLEEAGIEDFFETKKSGKKKAKTAFVRGVYSEQRVDGKKKKVFSPRVISLPTAGIPKKEYQYILDPAKLYRDVAR